MKINPLLLTVLCLAFTSIGFAQVVTPRRDVRDKPEGFDSTSYYHLTTQWQGDGKSLGVVNDASHNKLTLADTSRFENQAWKIISLGNGYYRLTTAWQGDGQSLDIVNDGSNNKLTLTNTSNASGQSWKITPVGVSGYYRLTTAWQGDGKSLEVVNDGTNNQLILANTANQPGQLWKITKFETALARLRMPAGPPAVPPGYTFPDGQPVNPRQPGSGAGAGSGPGAPETNTIYEEVPDVPASDMAAVMNWIKVQTTGVKLPYCWRQTYNRKVVGPIPTGRVADCPSGYTNTGLFCTRGADTIGAPSKVPDCPSGYTNIGLVCSRAFPPSVLEASSMTCPGGYFKTGVRCYQNCPAGYTSVGETCHRPVSTLTSGRMLCNRGEELKTTTGRCYPYPVCGQGNEEDAGLCYSPACRPGYKGVGFVCWQSCDPNWVSCGAGCGKTTTVCAMTITNQVVSTLVVAVNIATLGMASPETAELGAAQRAAIREAQAGARVTSQGRTAGQALTRLFSSLKSGKKLVQDTKVIRKVYAIKSSKEVKFFLPYVAAYNTALQAHRDLNQYKDAYAADFANQTSPEINATIDRNFGPEVALHIKKQWSLIQLKEMASANQFLIAQDVLGAVSIVDFTGATGLVSAFLHPTCQDVTPFPRLSRSYLYGY